MGKEVSISDLDVDKLNRMLSTTRNKVRANKINTILLLSKGYSINEISDILNVNTRNLKIYRDLYLKQGVDEMFSESPIEDFEVDFHLKQHGLIDFFIRFNNLTVKIHLSNVFDPISDMLNWYGSICEGDKVVLLRINEEKTFKRITFSYIPEFALEIFELKIVSCTSEKEEYNLRKMVYKKNFIRTLYDALIRLSEDAQFIQWRSDYNLSDTICQRLGSLDLN
jgi:hypothetical protein